MDQNMSACGPPAEAGEETRQLPAQLRTELPTELPQGKRGLALLLQAAWHASEDGRDTMRDILHELELRGAQGVRFLEHVDQRYEALSQTFEEHSWQACDRLEQVSFDVRGVSNHLEQQSSIASEQLRAQREATTTLLSTHSGLAQQLEPLDQRCSQRTEQ